jgi:hypothetical protein
MNSKTKNKIRVASFEDTFAIGINCGLPDYKLAWFVNRKLGIDFTREEDLYDSGIPFSFFYYTGGENCQVYNLVSIQSQNKALLDFNPRLDYLLVIRNGVLPEKIDFIIKNLREIEGIVHAFLLDINKGKALKQALELIELQEIYLLEKIKKQNSLEYVRQEVLRRRNVSTYTEHKAPEPSFY